MKWLDRLLDRVRGPMGPMGPPGPAGPNGRDGASIMEVAQLRARVKELEAQVKILLERVGP